MFFVTGDTHRDFRGVARLCEIMETSTRDTLIILGDVGINYFGDSSDTKWKKKLSALPITLFCIKGNHENYAGNITSYEVVDYCGAKAFVEPQFSNLVFAMDGEVYQFGNKKVLVIGGAYSVDKDHRIANHMAWFSDEQPSEATKRKVGRSVRVHREVDFVMSHTCPAYMIPTEAFIGGVDQSTVDTSTEEWLEEISNDLGYDKWYCGHFHINKKFGKMRFLFDKVKALDTGEY